MALGVDVIKSFVDSTTAETTTSDGTTTAYGTIKAYDNAMYVQIDGSSMYTPIASSTTKYKDGDRVLVTIKDHKIGVSGNFTEPAETQSTVKSTVDLEVNTLTADFVKTDKLVATEANLKELIATKATIDDLNASKIETAELIAKKADITALNAEKARIDTLESTSITTNNLNAEIIKTNTITAMSGQIADLESNTIKTDTLDAEVAKIVDLKSDTATIKTLTAGFAKVTDLEATNGKIETLDSTTIHTKDLEVSDSAIVNYLKANYADIGLANVDTGVIKNGTIVDGAIGDAMIGNVSANKLTAGTIDASDITVLNLNASNITTGSITVGGIKMDLNSGTSSISGEAIDSGAITSDKLSQEVQNQIDGAIETWTVSVVPTLTNEPASNWTTDDLKSKHVGDVAYVVNSSGEGSSSNGFCYRFCYDTTTKAYSWTLIQDTDVTSALSQIKTMDGTITQFKSDYATYTKNTDAAIETIQKEQTIVEGRIGENGTLTTLINNSAERINTAEGNITDLSKTVNTNTKNIGDISTTISETIVDSATYKQTAEGWTNSIKSLEKTTYGDESDPDSVKKSLVNRATAVEATVDGIKTDIYKTSVDETTGETVTTLDVYHKDETAAYVKQEFQSAVSSIVVGGTNLLVGTETAYSLTADGSGSQTVIPYSMSTTFSALAKKEIVLSGRAQFVGIAAGTFGFCTASTTNQYIPSSTETISIVDVSNAMAGGGLDFVFKTTVDTSNTDTNLQMIVTGVTDGVLTLSRMKLEVGNKQTDWSPAPADKVSTATYTVDANGWNANFKQIANNIDIDEDADETSIQINSNGVTIGKSTSDLQSNFTNDKLDFVNTKTTEVILRLDALNSSVKSLRWQVGDYIWSWDETTETLSLTYSPETE